MGKTHAPQRKPTITASLVPFGGRYAVRLLAGHDPRLVALLSDWFIAHQVVRGGTLVPAGHGVAHTRSWMCEFERWPELKQVLADHGYALQESR